jgi:alpha-galactosidase
MALGSQAWGQEIRTPGASPLPRVNGPTVFGVRPGSPLVYKIPATGSGTLTYSVTGLPAGLSVDPATGMISGSIATPGDYPVTLAATNSLGTNTRPFTIKVGNAIGLTPAMGWNSWNVWGATVTAAKVYRAADSMAQSGLIDHGWSYINTDDLWQDTRGGAYNGIQGNSTFLAGGYSMQGMVDHIHSLGLKAGIYSTPWIQSYGGKIGGSANNPQGTWTFVSGNSQKVDGTYSFAQNDANQWAAWGIDYLKYDWNPRSPNPVSNAQFHTETNNMRQALNNVSRDIIYSYSNSMPFDQISDQQPMLNSWRTGGDITDSYSSVSSHAFGQDQWAPYSAPGHFNDPDMLEVGWVGKSATPHSTNLSADEQYTHITMWSLLSSPLLLGNDMAKLDQFTKSLVSNDEVLAVNQDALGQQALLKNGGTTLRVYAKDLEDGTKAVGLINTGSSAATVTANWSDLGISGNKLVRDLWRQADVGQFNGSFSITVAGHGAELFKISAPPALVTTLIWNAATDTSNWDTSTVNFNDGASNVAFSNGATVAFTDTAPAGATTINLGGNLTPATITVNSANRNYTFQGAGSIGGGGLATVQLIKSGSSTLTILNANSFAGGTWIRGGTLVVGGTSGSLGIGNITNSANLTFNLSNTTTLPNNIGGTGTITQSGSGTIILTGDNSFSGTTNINAGRAIQVGDGGNSGTLGGTGIINSSGSLVFNRSGMLIVSARINGSGTLVQNGAGNIVLTNTVNTTSTSINNGTLTPVTSNSMGLNAVNIAGSGSVNLGGGWTGSNLLIFTSNIFHLSGDGGGKGAITNRDYFADPAGGIGGNQQINAMVKVVLDGDTTVAAPSLGFDGAYVSGNILGRFDIRGTGAQLSLNGHNLTKGGNNFFDLVNCNVIGTGNIIVTGGYGSTLCLEGTTQITDDGGVSKIIVGDEAMLEFWGQGSGGATRFTRRVEMGDGTLTSNAYLSQGGGGSNASSMPMLLKGNLTIRPTSANQNNSELTLSGNITQDGTPRALRKINTGALMLSGVNSFTGGLELRPGTAPVPGSGTDAIISINGPSALPAANVVSFGQASGYYAELDLNGGDQTVAGLRTIPGTPGQATVAKTLFAPMTLTINNAADYTFVGSITDKQNSLTTRLSVLKTGSGTQTLRGSTHLYTGGTTVQAGKLAIDGVLTNSSSLTVTGGTFELTPNQSHVLDTTILSISAPGRVDLQDNKVIVNSESQVGSWTGSNYSGMTGLIALGRNGGAWNGAGGIVTSQSAAAAGNYTSIGIATAQEIFSSGTGFWAGRFVASTETLIMYTYGGDANLDGKINIDDYIRIDSGIGSQLTGWSNGDFNYDGKINIDDYATIIDANIGNQVGVFFTGSGVGEEINAVAVPEPMGLIVALAGVAIVAKRRRRR